MIKSNLISGLKLSNGSDTIDLRTYSDNYNKENMKKVPSIICCDKISNGQDTFSLSDLIKPKNEGSVSVGDGGNVTLTGDRTFGFLKYNTMNGGYFVNGMIGTTSENIQLEFNKYESVDSLPFENGKSYIGFYFGWNSDVSQYILYKWSANPYTDDDKLFFEGMFENSLTLGRDKFVLIAFEEYTEVSDDGGDLIIADMKIYDSINKLLCYIPGELSSQGELFYTDSQYV